MSSLKNFLPGVDVEQVLLAGDIHGEKNWFKHVSTQARRNGCQLILPLGDFGYWPRDTRFGIEFLRTVERTLVENDQYCVFIDGNHEDHDELDRLPLDPAGFRPISDRLIHLPRGFRFTLGGTTFVAAGGAVSIDRAHRVEGVDWFPQETLSWEDTNTIIDGGPADVVLAHDCPDGVDLGLGSYKDDLLSEGHRRTLRGIVEAVEPSWLFHGHYHHQHSSTLTLSSGKVVQVEGLDRDTKMTKAWRIVKPHLLRG